MNKGNISLWIALGTLITGCQVGPSYNPPQMDIEESWQQETSTHSTLLPWWQQFNDPLLEHCLSELVEQNYSVRLAQEKLMEALTRLRVARSGFFPKIDGAIQYSRAQPAGGTLSADEGLFGQPGITSIDVEQKDTIAGFDASWELDLFGRTKSLVEGAVAGVQEMAATIDDVLVSVLGEFGRGYIRLRGIQAQISLMTEAIDLYKKLEKLHQEKMERGLENETAFYNTKRQVSILESQLYSLQAEEHAISSGLAALLGQQPSQLMSQFETHQNIPFTSQPAHILLPSELLRRRPDIRLAERKIAKQNAQLRVAVADLFPRINLTGRGGYEFIEIGALSGEGFSWSYGANLLAPVFHAGELRGKVNQQRSLLRQAYLEYGQSVVFALQEAEETILRSRNALNSEMKIQNAYQDAEHIYAIHTNRYNAGISNEIELLNAKLELIAAKKECFNAQVEASIHLVALYKAFGGGYPAIQNPVESCTN